MNQYYYEMFGAEEMRIIFSEQNMIQKWIDVEVALCIAQEQQNIIPKDVAKKLEQVAKVSNFDFEQMRVDFKKIGFPILPFVKQLTKLCDHETARWVHYGATTQDILDTGIVLQMREGLDIVDTYIKNIIKALANLAENHKYTPMAGRTFQQLAAPITFGYKAAIWLAEIDRHKERLYHLKPKLLLGQCSGAVGTFATMNEKGLLVQKEMMKVLGLNVPEISWHVSRDSFAELVSIFGMLSATLGKIANEVAILMRSEIKELGEPLKKGQGASTTMPQKRNPIYCEPIIAIAHKMRGLVTSQLTAMIQEHERPVGNMHLEWMVISEAFILMSGSLKHSLVILDGVLVDKQKMKANLQLNGGGIMSESIMMGLAPKIGKEAAHHLMSEISGIANDKKISLKEALHQNEEVKKHLAEDEIDTLLNPINYIGVAPEMVDRVLAKIKNNE